MVTGGGTGIGYAFAARGDRVTITGRREQFLTEAATLLGARAGTPTSATGGPGT
ncbi:3-oxoacyl-[acyl-carrier-protein] reductase [Amycolatopsis keratiniphila]|uniref:3-oxoacyl-[acyl-carrier-protein] reductase n=1 Tax=Amycolatopsis keratiniphila TaxID=129921 RepID=R4T429_9PSEU|nr:3-oxoacyl-[acyl-carrier-protein] reductase [Amycolatopsis keratiniphila]